MQRSYDENENLIYEGLFADGELIREVEDRVKVGYQNYCSKFENGKRFIIIYDESKSGVRQEETIIGDNRKVAYYVNNGKFIGEAKFRNYERIGETSVDVKYYQNPMRVQQIIYYKNNIIVETDAFYQNGQPMKQFNEKDLTVSFYEKDGSLKGKHTFKGNLTKLIRYEGVYYEIDYPYGDVEVG